MIRNLVSDRRARGLVMGLVLLPGIACSSMSARMPIGVPPEVAARAAAEFAQTERTPGDLPAGARIRYNTGERWYGVRAARVSRATADTIWVESGEPVAVARLRRLEVSLTGDTKAGPVIWGGVIGAGVGAIIGASLKPSRCDPDCEGAARGVPPGAAAMILGTCGGVIGMLGTAIIAPSERWDRVNLPPREGAGQ